MAYPTAFDRSWWSDICTAIAVPLERDRKAFFENCLKIAKVKQKDDCLPIEPDLALRAYQLLQATRLISARKYISPSDGRDFADLLWAQVCGTHLDDVLELVERYQEKPKEEAERFGFDVARYIVGDDTQFPPSAFGLMAEIMMMTPQLTGHTATIIATAFGDQESVQDIRTQLERRQKR